MLLLGVGLLLRFFGCPPSAPMTFDLSLPHPGQTLPAEVGSALAGGWPGDVDRLLR